jgi:hypothetical protein
MSHNLYGSQQRSAWNTERPIGPKPPLRSRQIRTRLQHCNRVRDLAMFNLASDRKLRGGNLGLIRVSDIAMGETVRLRTSIVQQRMG